MMKCRAWMLAGLMLCTGLLFAQSQPPVAPPGARLTAEQRQWLSKAERHERAGWIYLHIEGAPRARGFQHGYLLAREIQEGLRQARIRWTYKSSMDWMWLVRRAKAMFASTIDAEDLEEMAGIAEGATAAGVATTRDDIVTYNAMIELRSYWWPEEMKKLGGESSEKAPESCSSFIATGSYTADGKVVLGHNTMSGFAEPDANVVLDIMPARGHRIMMQTTAGWIHSGTDFFITDAGLVGSETTIGGFSGFDASGIPEFVRVRRAMQDASSLSEWIAIMKKRNNGGYANAWLVGDIKTNEIARLELGLKYTGEERTKDGFFAGSNVAENLKILRLETTKNDVDIRLSSIARRVRWKQLMRENKGRITLDLAKAFEADHYDTYLKGEFPGSRTLCGHFELDSLAYGDIPFSPEGTIDAKVVDAAMAGQMAFAARWGSACGRPFDAEAFLRDHPQFDWMAGVMKSRPSEPWTVFTAGERR